MKKLLLLLSLSSCTKYTIIVVQPKLNEAVVRDTIDISGFTDNWKYYPYKMPSYSPDFFTPLVYPDSIKFGFYPNQILRISSCTDSILNDSTFKIKKQ